MNRSIFLFTLVGALTLVGCANGSPGEADASGEAPKLKNETKEATWLTDFAESKTLAAEEERPILVNFTGSDWCAPCMQLKKDVFGTAEFSEYAEENLVLLELDFPRGDQSEELKQKNEKLAGEFEVQGFPTIVLLSPEGDELSRFVGYRPGGVQGFVEWTEDARGR